MENWEKIFAEKIAQIALVDDPAHDLLHFQRVVTMAKKLASTEGANLEVVVPAAWLHDFVIIPKNSPLRSKASQLSAEGALQFLRQVNYPEQFHTEIGHAIEAHSFSANIETRTLEAKVVQDADRLDGLGAIGTARCFATSGLLKRAFYCAGDPFCTVRPPDDKSYTIDHFFQKLFKTVQTLKTAGGRAEGERRAEFMKTYLAALEREISTDPSAE